MLIEQVSLEHSLFHYMVDGKVSDDSLPVDLILHFDIPEKRVLASMPKTCQMRIDHVS